MSAASSAPLSEAAGLLQARGRYAVGQPALPASRLALFIGIGGALYGMAMGSLEGRWLGGVYSGLKVPVLVFGSTLLCLPSFFVLNVVLGLRHDFPAALRGILSAQGTVALCLGSLSPVIALFYLSSTSYPAALLLNGMLFGAAVVGGQHTLRRHYAPLLARSRRHRLALASWGLLYVFVSIKLGWVLRPFVGDPALPVVFLRADRWMEDPYTNLFWAAAALVAKVLGLA